MNKTALNRAIAVILGTHKMRTEKRAWIAGHTPEEDATILTDKNGNECVEWATDGKIRASTTQMDFIRPKNYAGDLDDMREAELWLRPKKSRSYAHELAVVVLFENCDINKPLSFSPKGDSHELDEEFALYTASAERRAKAFLRVFGQHL